MKSMTGMGRSKGAVGGIPVRLEIKSVNHRFCEVHFRAPSKYATLELKVQRLVKDKISRGRIDIFLSEERAVDPSETEMAAYKSYHSYLQNIRQTLGLSDEITLSQLVSGVGGWIPKDTNADEVWKELEPLLKAGIDDLISMRNEEGDRLKKVIQNQFLTIQKIKEDISSRTDDVKVELQEKIGQKVRSKIEEWAEVDAQRLATEVVFYLERMDITEELDRLDSHLKALPKLFEGSQPMGRKVDFLLQEFNREFNTITSKCSNSKMAQLVVDAKSELEKVREQIQNIE